MKPFYQEAGITIYRGDCLEVLAELQVEADACITDPPYGEHTHAKQWIGAALDAKGDKRNRTKHKGLGFDALAAEVRDAVAVWASLRVKRWSLFFSDLEGIDGWRRSVGAAGLDYVRSCIWDKVDSAPQFTGDRPAAGAEAIVCAHPAGAKRWNGGGRRNVFRHPVNAERGFRLKGKPHPSTKPHGLMLDLVGLFSEPGELIVDPFMGSGSTLVAAKDQGRRAIGIEREHRWCEVAVDRLRQEVLPFVVGQ